MCAFGWVWVAAVHVRVHVHAVLHMQDAEVRVDSFRAATASPQYRLEVSVGVSQASAHLISVKSAPRQHSDIFSVDHEGDWKCLYK